MLVGPAVTMMARADCDDDEGEKEARSESEIGRGGKG